MMRWVPLLVVLSLAGLCGWLIGHTTSGPKRRWRLLILAYLTALGIILFTPVSFDGAAVYVMPAGSGQVNLTRLAIFNLGFAENILLTVPLGILIKRVMPRLPLILVAVLGLMIGGGIEITQHYLSLAYLINRSSDINDVLANGMGVALGGLMMAGLHKIIARPRLRRSTVIKNTN